MKRFFTVIVAVLALAALASFTLAQDALTQTFTAADGSFSFKYPDGWTPLEIPADSSSGGVSAVYLTNSGSGVQLVIAYGPADSVSNVLGAAFPVDTTGAKTTTIQINGSDVVRLELVSHVVEYIVTFDSGNQLVALVAGSPDDMSKTDPTVMAIVASFQASGAGNVVASTAADAGTSGGSATAAPVDLSSTQPITLANAAQMAKITTLANKGSEGNSVDSVAFSPDGKSLAVAVDSNINLLDIATGNLITTFQGHTDLVLSVAFSPDGKTLGSGGQDQTVRLWDVATGKLLNTFTVDTGYPRCRIAFSPDGKIIAQGNYGPLKMWDVATGKEIKTVKATGGDTGINNEAFSPDGTLIATAGADTNVQVFEVKTGKLVATLKGHTQNVEGVVFSPDGKTLASIADDKTIILWDVATEKALNTLQETSSGITVAFSADGSVVASSSTDLFDVASGKLLTTLQSFAGFSNATFSADGKLFAFADSDGTIELWGTSAS